MGKPMKRTRGSVKVSDLIEVQDRPQICRAEGSSILHIGVKYGKVGPTASYRWAHGYRYIATACNRAIDAYAETLIEYEKWGYRLCSRCGTLEDFQKAQVAQDARIAEWRKKQQERAEAAKAISDEINRKRKEATKAVTDALRAAGLDVEYETLSYQGTFYEIRLIVRISSHGT
jgi:hypothetical protein